MMINDSLVIGQRHETDWPNSLAAPTLCWLFQMEEWLQTARTKKMVLTFTALLSFIL